MRRLLITLITGVTLLVVGVAGGAALAAGKLHVLSKACVAAKSRAVTAPTNGKCPKGSLLEQVGSVTRGATGAQGPQGPAGTPAAAKSYVVNYRVGGALPMNASTGVTMFGTPYDSSTTHEEGTTWDFPVDVSTCGVTATVVGNGAFYSVYNNPPGPMVQVARLNAHRLYVVTTWAGGTGADFSLLVTCP